MFRSLLRIRRVFPILSVVTLSKDDESKALFNACVNYQTTTRRILLARNANPNAVGIICHGSPEGIEVGCRTKSVLEIAIDRNDADLVHELIVAKANIPEEVFNRAVELVVEYTQRYYNYENEFSYNSRLRIVRLLHDVNNPMKTLKAAAKICDHSLIEWALTLFKPTPQQLTEALEIATARDWSKNMKSDKYIKIIHMIVDAGALVSSDSVVNATKVAGQCGDTIAALLLGTEPQKTVVPPQKTVVLEKDGYVLSD